MHKKQKSLFIVAVMLLVSTIVFTACGGSGSPEEPPTRKRSDNWTQVGEKIQKGGLDFTCYLTPTSERRVVIYPTISESIQIVVSGEAKEVHQKTGFTLYEEEEPTVEWDEHSFNFSDCTWQ